MNSAQFYKIVVSHHICKYRISSNLDDENNRLMLFGWLVITGSPNLTKVYLFYQRLPFLPKLQLCNCAIVVVN